MLVAVIALLPVVPLNYLFYDARKAEHARRVHNLAETQRRIAQLTAVIGDPVSLPDEQRNLAASEAELAQLRAQAPLPRPGRIAFAGTADGPAELEAWLRRLPNLRVETFRVTGDEFRAAVVSEFR